jgi:hypothetical protein
MPGGVGEKSLRRLLELSLRVAERSLPADAEHLRRLAGDASSMADALSELRASGEGAKPQAESLARGLEARLGEIVATVQQAISRYKFKDISIDSIFKAKS